VSFVSLSRWFTEPKISKEAEQKVEEVFL